MTNKTYIPEYNYFKAMNPKDLSSYSNWIVWRNRSNLALMQSNESS